MNKKFKIVLTIAAVIVVGFFSVRYYVYNAGKRDIQSEQAAFTVSTKSIVAEFTANVDASNKKYLEKPVAISGTVTSVKDSTAILDDVVDCKFITPDNSIKAGQNVTVKGRVVGYDDLLGELKLDQCKLNK